MNLIFKRFFSVDINKTDVEFIFSTQLRSEQRSDLCGTIEFSWSIILLEYNKSNILKIFIILWE